MSAPHADIDHARIAQACAYAIGAHAGQLRKATSVPYAAHVLAVGALVLEHGGSTEQVIAGLLHDVVEDCGGELRLAEVRRVFGNEVAEIVDAVSDAAPSVGQEKAPWRQRKEEYLRHLVELAADDAPALLVSACDRLQNLTAIVTDLDDPQIGTAVFGRFNAPDVGSVVWNHRSVVGVFLAAPDALIPSRLKGLLARALARIETAG
jgi:(p)ppGpp synthase/HD superfamily hydrolase